MTPIVTGERSISDAFRPTIKQPGLISAYALADYQNDAVYLRTSRYMSPRWGSRAQRLRRTTMVTITGTTASTPVVMAEDEHHQHHDRDQQLQPPLAVTGYTFNTGG